MDTDQELHARVAAPIVKKQKVYKRECGYCGEIFETHSHTARYCPRPKQCRQKAYRDRAKR